MKASQATDPLARANNSSAFSLIELLAVMSIILVIAGFSIPAMTGISGAAGFNGSVVKVSGLLDQARQYAVTQNTYVWVALRESTPSNGESNQVEIAIIASKDGTKTSDGATAVGWNANLSLPTSNLVLINKLETAKATNLPAVSSKDLITDPENTPAHEGALLSSTLTFQIQSPSAGAKVAFDRVILFSPRGEALVGPSPVGSIDLVLRLARGQASDPHQVAVIQTNGFTGGSRVYRP